MRLIHAWRYRRAGLKSTLERIAPDVFHAHYIVEHAFYGSLTGFHPYVVSAWGSDLLVESHKRLGRSIARYTLRNADLITANDPSLAHGAVALGAAAERVHVVRLGIDEVFFSAPDRSVNLQQGAAPPTIISDRALEPLYNVDALLRAFAGLRKRLPATRLRVASGGSERLHLEALARELGLGDSISFLGRLQPQALLAALQSAHVYVSVPRSDSFALSNLEAMAAGCFPVLSDLPSLEGMIRHRVNGLVVPAGDVEALSEALHEALDNPALRLDALRRNRALAESDGRLERNMLAMERHYYRLAGHPLGGSEAI